VRWGPIDLAGVRLPLAGLARDGVLVVLGLLSLARSPAGLRAENAFTWAPIREVAILFAAIFVTIVPVLAILDAGDHGALAGVVRRVQSPWHYFWITGLLSSVLDNAPTYLTFLNTALGTLVPGSGAEGVPALVAQHPRTLAAISCGAVYMGALTYIGNAPNFIVRSIAVESGVAMPKFFGYSLRWAVPVLMPAFLIVTLLFFR
jgi:Na+/H+ antiporter NhaD/arsenite permease-like protein